LSGSQNHYSNNSAFRNDDAGFHLFGYNNTIKQNDAHNNSIGFICNAKSYNLFSENVAYNNERDGFYFCSEDISVVNNTAYGNKNFGMLFYSSIGMNISLNKVFDNKDGIALGFQNKSQLNS